MEHNVCLPMISSGLECDTVFCEIVFGITGTIFCFNMFKFYVHVVINNIFDTYNAKSIDNNSRY